MMNNESTTKLKLGNQLSRERQGRRGGAAKKWQLACVSYQEPCERPFKAEPRIEHHCSSIRQVNVASAPRPVVQHHARDRLSSREAAVGSRTQQEDSRDAPQQSQQPGDGARSRATPSQWIASLQKRLPEHLLRQNCTHSTSSSFYACLLLHGLSVLGVEEEGRVWASAQGCLKRAQTHVWDDMAVW